MLASNDPSSDRRYRAIYITERTVHGLAEKISKKYLLKPNCISQILYITRAGIEILVDDDFVREMAEGQPMEVSIDPIACQGVETPDGLYGIRLSY